MAISCGTMRVSQLPCQANVEAASDENPHLPGLLCEPCQEHFRQQSKTCERPASSVIRVTPTTPCWRSHLYGLQSTGPTYGFSMRPLCIQPDPCLNRPVVGLTLMAFLLASIGYPLWSGGEGKDLSQPFPCMYRQCGCRNAQQCWGGCCCFSNKQKLAWAKANGVKPPQFVAAAAEQEASQPAKAKCCATKKSGACQATAAPMDQEASSLTAVIEAVTCMSRSGSHSARSMSFARTCGNLS
jgi:hypothetical protein